MFRCEECGVTFPCIGSNDLCKECDEQYDYCFNKCGNSCRSKQEQRRLFDKWKPDWDKE